MGKHSRRPPEEKVSRPVEELGLQLPPLGLRRAEDGRVVLDEVEGENRRAAERTAGGAARDDRGAESGDRSAQDDGAGPGGGQVDGPIQPTPTIYFGRPPGTENRRAGAVAMVGSLCLLAAALLPWATREPASLGATTLGWRDAHGGFGPAPWMLLLAVVALGLSIAALSGVLHRALQVGDALVGVVAIVISVVEWFRIRDAAALLAELTDGRASMGPSWAIPVGIVGGVAMLVAAAVHRSTAPAWRQA